MPGKSNIPPGVAEIPFPENEKDRVNCARITASFSSTFLEGYPWPKVSIITPSYNQGLFIENTIRSVLLQGYPNLEYIIIDGGSTDESVEIIKKYEPWLSYWVSEKDGGQYDAINKGFGKSTGEIMAWLNSDDMYFPWALWTVAEIFSSCSDVQWLTSASNTLWDQSGRAFSNKRGEGFNREAFYRGRNAGIPGFHAQFVQQESTFWRRSLWNQVEGYLDTRYSLAGDFDLWARFWQHADLYCTSALLGGFRIHSGQKTESGLDLYRQEALQVLGRYNRQIPGRIEKWLIKFAVGRPFTRRFFSWPTRWVDFDHQAQQWRIVNRRVAA